MTDDVIDAEVVEVAETLPAVRAANAVVVRDEISVEELVQQADKIRQVMRVAMKPDVHYGVIPGTGSKPTLLKPGAEMLNVLLRLAPSYVSERVFGDDGHLTVVSRCTLTHIPSGLQIAEGEGMCSTRESKYAYRKGDRACPDCGAAAIIKGRAEYGGGWLCFGKKGGCGAKWPDGTEQAQAFETMDVGKVPNPDLADSWNTVLKMAAKRALLAACLNGTAASDIFTQDMEDAARPAESAPAGATAARQAPADERSAGAGQPAEGELAPAKQVRDFWKLVDKVASVDPDGTHTKDWWHALADRAAERENGGRPVARLTAEELGALAIHFQEHYAALAQAKASAGETASGEAAPVREEATGTSPAEDTGQQQTLDGSTESQFKAPTGPRGSKRQTTRRAA